MVGPFVSVRDLREVSLKLQDTRAKKTVFLMTFYVNFEAISQVSNSASGKEARLLEGGGVVQIDRQEP